MTPVLCVSRVIRAAPDRVFAAWTDPEQLVLWWGPPGVECTLAHLDGRVGGKYRIENTLPDGNVVVIHGEFLTWEPPRALSYTWWVTPGQQKSEERVSVHFDATTEGTRVSIVHERIQDAPTRASHEAGWEGCLEGLERHFENYRRHV